MDLGFTFDATEVPESERTEFEPIPAGTRALMQITEADLVPTKSGQGIKYKAQIISGQYENRIVLGFINIENASEMAKKIGKRELADLCLAIGRPQVDCTEDLLFAPFEGTLGIERGRVNEKASSEQGVEVRYQDRNVIKKYLVHGGEAAAASKNAAMQRSLAPTPGAKPELAKPVGNKPWQNKAA